MAKTSFVSRLKRLWYSNRKQRTKGFTLLELLIVTAIGATIVSGLVYIVVELMGADQRESSRSETQREMQLAMDYISNEMREAVFVYTGECFDGTVASSCIRGAAGASLSNFIPASLTASNRSIPIVAFWRQYPLPDALRNGACRSGNPPGVCLNGNSYALIVYSLNKENDPLWRGRARITRYAFTQFNNQGAANPGYADPGETTFETWPFSNVGGNIVNEQDRNGGRPTGAPAVLVDFVDDGSGALVSARPDSATQAFCPDNPVTNVDDPITPTDERIDYYLTPSTQLLNSLGFNNARSSFYACVSPTRPSINQDVVLYARGNARGRAGINTDRGFLPPLETRVLIRGVLNRTPPS